MQAFPSTLTLPQKVQVSQSCIIMTSPPHQKSSSGKSMGVREFNREQFNNRGTHCLTALGVAGRYRIFTTVNDLKNKHTNPFWAFSARRALVCASAACSRAIEATNHGTYQCISERQRKMLQEIRSSSIRVSVIIPFYSSF